MFFLAADDNNQYLNESVNLALNMKFMCDKTYPLLARKIYVRKGEYCFGLKPYTMLVEFGANTNSSEEALNSVKYFVDILEKVFYNRQ